MAVELPGPSVGVDGVLVAPAGGICVQIPVFSVSRPAGQLVLDKVLVSLHTCVSDRYADCHRMFDPLTAQCWTGTRCQECGRDCAWLRSEPVPGAAAACWILEQVKRCSRARER
jgi:hypothetical protein